MSALLAKFQAYILTGVACLLVGFGFGWMVHGWQMKASQAHVVQAQASALVKAVQKQDQITAKVAETDAKKQQQIHVIYRTLEREVPVYVTPEVDHQYPVSNRLVGVLDRALAVPAVPDGAGSADDSPAAPSSLTESDLGGWATQVIEQYNSTRQQLIDLQAWVLAQESGHNPKEVSMVDWEQLVKDGKAEMVGGRLYQNRVEVGRLVDGKFVEHEGAVEAAAAAPEVVANSAATVNSAASQAADQERQAAEHAAATSAEAQSLGPVTPESHDEKPGDRPAVDAAAMLGD